MHRSPYKLPAWHATPRKGANAAKCVWTQSYVHTAGPHEFEVVWLSPLFLHQCLQRHALEPLHLFQIAAWLCPLYHTRGNVVDVSEIYNTKVFTTKATALNLIPGTSFDICEGYDLSDPKVQEQVWANLEQEKPLLIVGSLPSSAFS